MTVFLNWLRVRHQLVAVGLGGGQNDIFSIRFTSFSRQHFRTDYFLVRVVKVTFQAIADCAIHDQALVSVSASHEAPIAPA
ncbi:MAG: hypothetical protein AB7L90_17330 [Hyphomicrobiaceae bacterium]